MLEMMKKLDSGTIRGLIVVTIPLLVMIASMFGVDEALFETKLAAWGEKVVAFVALAGVAYAAYSRIFKATPPISEAAAQKTQEMLATQSLERVSTVPTTEEKKTL